MDEMVKKIMYQRVQNLKKQGFTKAETVKETGLNKRTVKKYYNMTEKQYLQYIEKVRCRVKIFDTLKPDILDIYGKNDFKELERSAIYDYLEEKFGDLPGTDRSFRNYISYLIDTGQLKLNGNKRIYYPVEEQPYGKQMQIDFGEYRTRSGLKLYIFAGVLSASRYKYCDLQDRPFTTLDLINHLLNCFEYLGGMPQELVIDQDSVMVVSENKGDIIYTRDFKQFIQEMGLKIYVCRKKDPESKGKIENVIKFVKRSFLKIRDFETVRKAKERLFRWLIRKANGKLSLATRRIPKEMFAEEKKHLKPLKNSIYRKDTSTAKERRKVNNLGQISVASCKYPVPEEYRDKEVEIYKTDEKIFIYDIYTGKKIKEYDRSQIPGRCIQNHDRYYRKKLKQKELKEKLKDLFEIDIWDEFIEKNFGMYPRYFRDQYNEAIRKFSNGIKTKYLQQAIELCLENRTYSMANLWDTYQYYKREAELGDMNLGVKIDSRLRNIPPEKKKIQVEKRDIGIYLTLVNASKGGQP